MGGSPTGLGPQGLCGASKRWQGQQDAEAVLLPPATPVLQVRRPQLLIEPPEVRRGVDLGHLGPVELGLSPVLGTSHTVPSWLSPDPMNPGLMGAWRRGPDLSPAVSETTCCPPALCGLLVPSLGTLRVEGRVSLAVA